MKLVVNTIPLLSELTGIGKYTYELSKRLLVLNPTFYYGFYSKELKLNMKKPESIDKFPLLKKVLRKILKLRKKEFDVYFEPNFIPLENIKSKKTIVTIHDFSFRIKEWHPKERYEYFKENFFKNINRADIILTPSHFIKDEVKEILGFEDVRVIYNGVDRDIFKRYDKKEVNCLRDKLGVDRFILFVGSIEPRKNLKSLLKAYNMLNKNEKKEFNLVLVGAEGWKNEEIKELIEKNRDYIKYAGYLSDLELAYAYNLADFFVYPSLYEGFGIPPIEAMACGCAVMVSNRASLPEVCGDGAYYCDVEVESIYEGLKKMIYDEELKKDLREKGKNRAQFFDWDKSANKLIEIIKECNVR